MNKHIVGETGFKFYDQESYVNTTKMLAMLKSHCSNISKEPPDNIQNKNAVMSLLERFQI